MEGRSESEYRRKKAPVINSKGSLNGKIMLRNEGGDLKRDGNEGWV
jgi:hypothetical protein